MNSDLSTDEIKQEQLLPGVSRTFALTIPQLPDELRPVVTNGYLLCRIADTIEDDAKLTVQQKQAFHQQFISVLSGEITAKDFAAELSPLLSDQTLAAERDLILKTPTVVRCTQSYKPSQRNALINCVTKMSEGMPMFERSASLKGLNNLGEFNRYCYFVAGVVGEMLTELFCDYSEEINQHREQMMQLGISFGLGLQMTNILKDIWDDRQRGVCWLPQDIFNRTEFDLSNLSTSQYDPAFGEGLQHLVGIAYNHLQNALDYTLLIPNEEKGIRLFCLWAIGLAVMTLKNIHETPEFKSGKQVKVPRPMVKKIILVTRLANWNNRLLRFLFDWAGSGLPETLNRKELLRLDLEGLEY